MCEELQVVPNAALVCTKNGYFVAKTLRFWLSINIRTELYFLVSHSVMKDRGSTCKFFENCLALFTKFTCEPSVFITLFTLPWNSPAMKHKKTGKYFPMNATEGHMTEKLKLIFSTFYLSLFHKYKDWRTLTCFHWEMEGSASSQNLHVTRVLSFPNANKKSELQSLNKKQQSRIHSLIQYNSKMFWL